MSNSIDKFFHSIRKNIDNFEKSINDFQKTYHNEVEVEVNNDTIKATNSDHEETIKSEQNTDIELSDIFETDLKKEIFDKFDDFIEKQEQSVEVESKKDLSLDEKTLIDLIKKAAKQIENENIKEKHYQEEIKALKEKISKFEKEELIDRISSFANSLIKVNNQKNDSLFKTVLKHQLSNLTVANLRSLLWLFIVYIFKSGKYRSLALHFGTYFIYSKLLKNIIGKRKTK